MSKRKSFICPYLMPFGKYKGKPISALPRDYLIAIAKLESVKVDDEVFQAILDHLTGSAIGNGSPEYPYQHVIERKPIAPKKQAKSVARHNNGKVFKERQANQPTRRERKLELPMEALLEIERLYKLRVMRRNSRLLSPTDS